MAEALTLLEHAKKHLIAFESDLALERMQDFERAVLSGLIQKDGVDACSQALQEIRALAAAAREGVAAAQRQVAEIVALSSKLDTYDSQGKKTRNRIGQNRTRRF